MSSYGWSFSLARTQYDISGNMFGLGRPVGWSRPPAYMHYDISANMLGCPAQYDSKEADLVKMHDIH